MTAPLADFTPAETERLQRIEDAPAAPESIHYRLRSALFFAEGPWMSPAEFDAGTTDPRVAARLDALATAALAVLRGPAPDDDTAAVRRVLALADELDGLAEHLRHGGERAATLRAAASIRAAVDGAR